MSGTDTSEGPRMEPDCDSALFDRRFWRCRGLLHFIACRILNDSDLAKTAVENCWHSAFGRAPYFEHEGAFRSWLMRILIDEALLLLREGQQSLETNAALGATCPPQNGISAEETDAQGLG